jgi:hypothetical protein
MTDKDLLDIYRLALGIILLCINPEELKEKAMKKFDTESYKNFNMAMSIACVDLISQKKEALKRN